LVETNTCGCEGEGQRVAIRNEQATRWQVSSASCALTDGSRCNDCTAGYAGARAACVQGLCTVTCPSVAVPPDAGIAACTPTTFADACAAVAGGHFLNPDGYQCVSGAGISPCGGNLLFDNAGTFYWGYEDIGERGTFACSGGRLLAATSRDLAVSYDRTCDVLTWEGVPYRRATW
jgi:hypothetical protein